MAKPQIIVIAGANGSGKSTSARLLVPSTAAFINADEIAKELPENVAQNKDMEAGRILLRRLDDLTQRRSDFALETTLASRSLAPRISRLLNDGYQFNLFFVWVPSPDLSVERVAARVRRGGHNIPEAVIRRRYKAGLINFFELYQPLANYWRVYQNINFERPELIASGKTTAAKRVYNRPLWNNFVKATENAK